MTTSRIKVQKLLYTDKKLFIPKLPTIEPFLILLSYSSLWVLQLSLPFPRLSIHQVGSSGLFHLWLFSPRVCDLALIYPDYPSQYNIKPPLIPTTHHTGLTILQSGLLLFRMPITLGLQWAFPYPKYLPTLVYNRSFPNPERLLPWVYNRLFPILSARHYPVLNSVYYWDNWAFQFHTYTEVEPSALARYSSNKDKKIY